MWDTYIRVGFLGVCGMFLESTEIINLRLQEFFRKWIKILGYPCGQRTGDRITSIHTVAPLNSDAVVFALLYVLPRGVSIRVAAIVRFGLVSTRKVLLFSWRVHSRGPDIIGWYNIFVQQGGRSHRAVCDFVKVVSLIMVEDFTSILLFVGIYPSRPYYLALDWEIDAGMEIGIIGTGFAVLH